MAPWAGEGFNLALWDSLNLAHLLASVPEVADGVAWEAGLELRIREFEEAMLARAQEKAEETIRNRGMFMSENGTQAMADFFKMYEDMATVGGPLQEKSSKIEMDS
jgi:2-polyprenyl-6-methoxyphenol hydroxylase-like FAD-dependent oxidoreductase